MALLKTAKLAAVTTVLAACGPLPDEVQPLSDDNRARVQSILANLEAELEVVEDLVSKTDNLCDAQGRQDKEAFLSDLYDTEERLREYWENESIYEYEVPKAGGDELKMGSEAMAYHHSDKLKPRSETDDNYIALNVSDITAWSPGLLMHEAGHQYGGHAQAISDVSHEGLSHEFVELVLDKHDFLTRCRCYSQCRRWL